MSEEMVAYDIIPFWNRHVEKYFKESYRWMRACTELLESYNYFGYTYLDIEMGKNWEKYKSISENKFFEIKNNIISYYKKTCLEKINERIVEAYETLERELKEATQANDQDLITEITFVKEELETVKNNVTETIKNLPEEIDIIYSILEWWPDILYPVPKVVISDEELKLYEHAKKLMIYFRDFVNDL